MAEKEVLQKMQRYCDYRDRCHKEVRSKLISIKVYGDDLEEIISILIDSDHLNEERYARSFARGKFRIKGWGRIRILRELSSMGIGEYLQRKALEEIDEEAYEKTIAQLFEKQYLRQPEGWPEIQRRNDLWKFGMRKGYEKSYIEKELEAIFNTYS